MSFRPPVHPFPARMAPELVEKKLSGLSGKKILIDPMMGSGTFVISAARRGHTAIGLDSDPLAHIIASASVGGQSRGDVLAHADRVLRSASLKRARSVEHDSETWKFIEYWFDAETIEQLGKLAYSISRAPSVIQATLWCALSRLIITKDIGVSLARDVSHSRPHRVRDRASFAVFDRFEDSVRAVLDRSGGEFPKGSISFIRADARDMPFPDSSVHGVMTSPPYLIAIDYLRGHRLSLVWMGYSVGELRELRSRNIGSERGSDLAGEFELVAEAAVEGDLPNRKFRILSTYIRDLDATISEISRVVRRKGSVTFVVANARHSAGAISVEIIVTQLAQRHGLEITGRDERALPPGRRYLPPPRSNGGSLDQRMHTEVVATFVKV